jgi:hypothetical protein
MPERHQHAACEVFFNKIVKLFLVFFGFYFVFVVEKKEKKGSMRVMPIHVSVGQQPKAEAHPYNETTQGQF